MIMFQNLNMIECSFTNCYVIRGSKGDILVDTGRESDRDYIETWLMNYNITLIILTHGHGDHVQNAAYFSRLFNAPVMISPYDMRLARDNNSRPCFVTTPLGKILKKQNEKLMDMPIERFEPKIYAEEGMDLSHYGIDGVIISLEGHTKGSIGILCKSSVGYDLYCGDALMSKGFPMMPMTCESPKRAKVALERIVTLSPDRILTGHGEPVCKGSKAYRMLIERF